jgi:hypothetical protein
MGTLIGISIGFALGLFASDHLGGWPSVSLKNRDQLLGEAYYAGYAKAREDNNSENREQALRECTTRLMSCEHR